MPGYLPESDVWITADWESARASLADDLARISDDESNSDDEFKQAVEAIGELAELKPGSEFLAYVGNSAYWLSFTDEEPDEDE
jgi:hypothetical protein